MTMTNFTALHDAMEGHFRKNMPYLATVDAYREETPSDKIATPAILVGVEEMTQGKKVTGGRLAMDCTFSAYCLLSGQTERAETAIRNMAAMVAMNIDGQHFGLGEAIGRPSNVSCVPGLFQSPQPGLECWIVSWEQTVHLGEVWSPPDIVNDSPAGTGQGNGSETGNGTESKIDGFYLAGCHDENHKLADFPEED